MSSTTDAGAPAVRDRRRTDTRQRMIDAAIKLLNTDGYTRTTVAEIERAVGLRPGGGGLYRHFASKDDLLLEAVRAYHERVRHLRAELAERYVHHAPGDMAGDLHHLVSALGSFLAGERPMIQLSLDTGALPEAVRHAIGDAWDDGYGMVADLLCHHGVPAARATTLSVSALGGLNQYVGHLMTWGQPPAGIAPTAFLEAWIEQWTTTLVHIEGAKMRHVRETSRAP